MPFTRPIQGQKLPEDLNAYIERLDSNGMRDARWPLYQTVIDHALELSAHGKKISNGDGADSPAIQSLLGKARPNEDHDLRVHRLDNFRQITYSAWKSAMHTLSLIFNARERTIKYPEMEGIEENLKEYLQKGLPYYGSLEYYMRECYFDEMTRDPNAVTLVMPTEESLFDDNDSPFLEPVPFLFRSDKVIDRVDDDYYLILSNRVSDIGGKVFYLVDTETIFIIKEKKKGFNVDIYWGHDMGICPVVVLGGEFEKEGDYGYYNSYLSGVLPFWDDALCLNSDLQAVQVRHAYPKYWEYKMGCPACNGRKTQMYAGGSEKSCSTCNGTGQVTSMGPGQGITLDPKKMGPDWPSGPPAGYISADVSSLKYMDEKVDKQVEKGFAAINMEKDVKNTNVAESGEAKKVGRADLHTFMMRVAETVYKGWTRIAFIIAKERYGMVNNGRSYPAKEIVPTILPPAEFDIFNAQDLAQDVASMTTAGVSPSVIAMAQAKLIGKLAGPDSDEERLHLTISQLDPLPGVGPADLVQISQDTSEIDRYVHVNLSRLVFQAMDEDEGFLDLDRKDKRERIYALAQEEKAKLLGGMIPIEGGEGGEPTNVDIEAEARARLKGTVGGVQGILQTQASVASGITQYEAGITILTSIYGFLDDEARRLLGKPVDLSVTKDKVPITE